MPAESRKACALNTGVRLAGIYGPRQRGAAGALAGFHPDRTILPHLGALPDDDTDLVHPPVIDQRNRVGIDRNPVERGAPHAAATSVWIGDDDVEDVALKSPR